MNAKAPFTAALLKWEAFARSVLITFTAIQIATIILKMEDASNAIGTALYLNI